MIWEKFQALISNSYYRFTSNFRPSHEQRVHYASKDEIKKYNPESPPNYIPEQSQFKRKAHYKPIAHISKKGASSHSEIANLINYKQIDKVRDASLASRYGMADQLWAMNTNSYDFRSLGVNTQKAIIRAQQYDANPNAANSLEDINFIRENILQAYDMDIKHQPRYPRP